MATEVWHVKSDGANSLESSLYREEGELVSHFAQAIQCFHFSRFTANIRDAWKHKRNSWYHLLLWAEEQSPPEYPRADVSDHWKPTPELRFRQEVFYVQERLQGNVGHRNILQQAWVTDDSSKKEWRDVPIDYTIAPSTQGAVNGGFFPGHNQPVHQPTPQSDGLAASQPQQIGFCGVTASTGPK